jgi:putative membrane protein
MRWRFITPVSIVLGVLPAAAWAQGRGEYWGWRMYPMGWMWGAWGIGMGLMMLLFWGAVIVAIVVGVRWVTGQGRPGPARPVDTALQILRERYARGEISREEFEQRKRDLAA